MKKFIVLSLAAMSLAGTLYAGDSGKCCTKEKKTECSSKKDKDCGSCDKADSKCKKSADKK